MPQCNATTKSGRPCRARAVSGSDRCVAHRRPALDPEAVQQIVMALRAGNYLEIAVQAAGVELDELLADPGLQEELQTARAAGEVRAIARIAQAAAEGNWQASAWLLERQYPDRWARPATRLGEEKGPPPVVGVDALDELAGKRASRRARSIGD